MGLREQNLRFGLLKALADAVADELKDQRGEHERLLFEEYSEKGTKAFDILLPDRRKVGTITLTGIGETYAVADDAAFLEWAAEHQPQMVKETVVPPQPEQRFREVNGAARSALLKRLEVDEDGQIYDPKTGLRPVGVVRSEPGVPTGFQTRFATEGRVALIEAYRSGQLNEIAGSLPMPAIEPADIPPWEESE